MLFFEGINDYLLLLPVFTDVQALATRLGLWENYPSAVHNQTKVSYF